MTDVPRTPREFFESYVPAHIARFGGAFAGRSSPGSILFDVGAEGSWSLRLDSGAIKVESGAPDDTLFRVAISPSDFESVVVAGAERLGEDAGLERQLVAVRALTLEDDRAKLLKEAKGTLAIRLTSPEGERRITVTLGREAAQGAPDCELACTLEDLWALQSGVKNPFELMMDGKVQITGNMQLAMVLGAALG